MNSPIELAPSLPIRGSSTGAPALRLRRLRQVRARDPGDRLARVERPDLLGTDRLPDVRQERRLDARRVVARPDLHRARLDLLAAPADERVIQRGGRRERGARGRLPLVSRRPFGPFEAMVRHRREDRGIARQERAAGRAASRRLRSWRLRPRRRGATARTRAAPSPSRSRRRGRDCRPARSRSGLGRGLRAKGAREIRERRRLRVRDPQRRRLLRWAYVLRRERSGPGIVSGDGGTAASGERDEEKQTNGDDDAHAPKGYSTCRRRRRDRLLALAGDAPLPRRAGGAARPAVRAVRGEVGARPGAVHRAGRASAGAARADEVAPADLRAKPAVVLVVLEIDARGRHPARRESRRRAADGAGSVVADRIGADARVPHAPQLPLLDERSTQLPTPPFLPAHWVYPAGTRRSR